MTLTFLPPNFDKDFWENHPNLVQINELLGIQSAEGSSKDWEDDLEGLSEEDDEGVEAADEGDDEEEDDQPVSSLTRNKFDLLMDDDQN